MKKTPYWQQLQDPRWQKRRLEIMSRDDFACANCCDQTSQLQVHHRWYAAGRMVWEYPDAALVTLCEECHKYETEAAAAAQDWETFLGLMFAVDRKNAGWCVFGMLEAAEHDMGLPKEQILATLLFAASHKMISKSTIELWGDQVDAFKQTVKKEAQ